MMILFIFSYLIIASIWGPTSQIALKNYKVTLPTYIPSVSPGTSIPTLSPTNTPSLSPSTSKPSFAPTLKPTPFPALCSDPNLVGSACTDVYNPCQNNIHIQTMV